MIEHYNAFISYKHAKEDIRVAEAIQHGLERFHIPSKLRKKTGIKRIQRIFRDKEELPITSDLSDDISYALEHSDFLIVICSTNTKESIWVPREIEFFLKNHTKRQILTVLVDGEPQDVIPDILLHEERIVTNTLGEQQTIQTALEPLSCDYRMPIGKANKNELPRLASALIGCSYDELMNRRRQYKMRRMALAFSSVLAVALAFGGYMLYSRNQIKKNYLESLRNQSRYLANESEQLLDKEQRITALQLALAALPTNDNDDRPVTAEAMRALTDATLAYTSLSGNNISAVWNYQMPNQIDEYMLSIDGTYLAARDSSDNVAIWDVYSHTRTLYLDNIDEELNGMSFITDDMLLLWSNHTAAVYKVNSSSYMWEYSLDDDAFKTSILKLDNGDIILNTLGNLLIQLDAFDGSVKKMYNLPDKADSTELSYYELVLSPDDNYVAFLAYYGLDKYVLGTFSLKDESTNMTVPQEYRIKNIYWADNNHLMAAYTEDVYSSNASMLNNSYLSTDHTYISCLKPTDLSELWNYDFISNEVNLYSRFLALPEQNFIAYCCGNKIGLFDMKTGELLYDHNVNDSIVDMSDRDGDGWPVYITSSGGLASPSPSLGSDSLVLTSYFTDDLSEAIVNNGVYAHQSFSREIIYYSLYVSDTDWTNLDENLILSSITDSFKLSDNTLAILTDENDIPTLTVFDLKNDSYFQIPLDEDIQLYQYKILGTWKDKLYLAYGDYTNFILTTVDLNDKSIYTSDLFETYMSVSNICSFENGKIIYTYKDNFSQIITAIYDVEQGDTSSYVMPIDNPAFDIPPKYIEESNLIYYADTEDYIVDVKSGDISKLSLPDNWEGTKLIASSPSGKEFAISDNHNILITNFKSDDKFIIECPGITPLGIVFYENISNSDMEILVAYDNGALYRYSYNDGSFIGKSDISTYRGFNFPAEFTFDYDNELLYIQIDKLTDVIDLNSMIETACIQNCFGHYAASDRFYTMSYTKTGENSIGYFKHYTLDELIQKGEDILQGAELTDEQKSEYGIY